MIHLGRIKMNEYNRSHRQRSPRWGYAKVIDENCGRDCVPSLHRCKLFYSLADLQLMPGGIALFMARTSMVRANWSIFSAGGLRPGSWKQPITSNISNLAQGEKRASFLVQRSTVYLAMDRFSPFQLG